LALAVPGEHYQAHLWRDGNGSATRVARAQVLLELPSIDRGEITGKGSINQRAAPSGATSSRR
jgi:hypothetical protein